MQVCFNIVRQNPDQSPRIQSYTLDVEASSTILDCLNRIKWELDGSLAFRKNCRNTICGSCGMKVNGRSALACKENIGSEIKRLGNSNGDIPTISVAPMGNLPIIKDLIVDMTRFWDDLERVDPYVSSQSRTLAEGEFLQTPEERAKLDQMGNCIMCGACYSECNAKTVNPEFVGPHALAKAYRMVADNRDQEIESRLEQYNESKAGVWGCTRCYFCNAVCPMEVAPMDQIGKIKGEILDRSSAEDSRPIRHRKVLVSLVKDGGWVDERKFALLVVGNYFRDLKGLLSLAPVGFRMVTKGKFPTTFDPSEGTTEVRSLIESVTSSQ